MQLHHSFHASHLYRAIRGIGCADQHETRDAELVVDRDAGGLAQRGCHDGEWISRRDVDANLVELGLAVAGALHGADDDAVSIDRNDVDAAVAVLDAEARPRGHGIRLLERVSRRSDAVSVDRDAIGV
jgi:hypothetical protein